MMSQCLGLYLEFTSAIDRQYISVRLLYLNAMTSTAPQFTLQSTANSYGDGVKQRKGISISHDSTDIMS